MTYQVVTFGQDALRAKAKPVAELTDEIRKLAADMLETMYAAGGVGLAAEQVGRDERICVIDVPADAERKECVEFNKAVEMPLVLINPEIKELSKATQRGSEGCLSFPEIFAQITRANEVAVEYTGLDGVRRTARARGLLARAIQHECDHLDGVLLVDKMSTVQRISVSGKLKRLQASC